MADDIQELIQASHITAVLHLHSCPMNLRAGVDSSRKSSWIFMLLYSFPQLWYLEVLEDQWMMWQYN